MRHLRWIGPVIALCLFVYTVAHAPDEGEPYKPYTEHRATVQTWDELMAATARARR